MTNPPIRMKQQLDLLICNLVCLNEIPLSVKSPCCDRWFFAAPYTTYGLVLHFSTLFCLLHYFDTLLHFGCDTIHYIYTNPINQITKLTKIQVYTKCTKLAHTVGTQVLKTDWVRLWYLTSTINSWHRHALGRCRSSVHTDQFQVVLNSICIGDLVNTMKSAI